MIEDHFGEAAAARYDHSHDPEFEPAEIARTVDLLQRLAGDGPALEFGIGTGRIALPLAERGVPVHGIDLSEAMVRRLRAKPGGDRIATTIGDFAATAVAGEFSLVYLVFNTLMNLSTQDAQVDCFRNAAGHLVPGGSFLVEVMVPELRKIPLGQNTVQFADGPEHWAYTVYDTVTQDATCHYLRITGDGRGEARSIPFRYVWPAELDLMARLAGLRLRHRWADWTGAPFTELSTRHVSVWERPMG
ncbi:class I SAM-dependent DNA methyltransferase [Kitasatospora sp. NPDC006697]|uniref:class I SAM-dependent DNA methyltransferase n=1 Tax=Kitasatospora sp. NPDC006697 TaxID=3364020 RepID=UPI0036B4E567